MTSTSRWRFQIDAAMDLAVFIAVHAVVALFFICVTRVVAIALERFGDPKLFDEVPLRYFLDAMDTVICVGLLAITCTTMLVFTKEGWDATRTEAD